MTIRMDMNFWFRRISRFRSPEAVRLCAALTAFDPDVQFTEPLTREMLMGIALALPYATLLRALDEMKAVGLWVRKDLAS